MTEDVRKYEKGGKDQEKGEKKRQEMKKEEVIKRKDGGTGRGNKEGKKERGRGRNEEGI